MERSKRDTSGPAGEEPVDGGRTDAAVNGAGETGGPPDEVAAPGSPASAKDTVVPPGRRGPGAKSRRPDKNAALNRIVVTDNALASLVGLAAHEVPGVVGMAPVSLGEGLRRVLGLMQVDEGVVIEHPHGDERADVDVHVVVAYGVNIPAVADSVRERVRYAAKHLAGIEVEDVRVHVDGVSRG